MLKFLAFFKRMGSGQLDCSDISAKEGSSSKQSSDLVSLHTSNCIDNLLVKAHAEDINQAITPSKKHRATKAQLLSRRSSTKEAIPEESFHLNSSDARDNEEGAVVPRVGDEYQVEVPTLLSNLEQYMSTVQYEYLVGSPVQILWVQLKESNPKNERSACTNFDDAKRSSDSKNKKKRPLVHNERNSELNTNVVDVQPDDRKDSQLTKLGLKVGLKAQRSKMNKSESHFIVHETQYKSWNDADVDNFLLGLHIFGKSFAQVKRFVENKDMGDILFFYYGKFCGSNMHRRWSDCIKRRNRKRAWGMKLFSGWRQQELISRLLSYVTKENQNKLLEVTKLFKEEGTSLEDYVFSLKAIVGLHNLAKAMGVGGKGKEDLTGIAMAPVCPKIPVGKACSSLEPSDIVKCLTGGFRLTKNQQNDIFWESIWPRLLARGWQSEQPRNRRCVGYQNYLVFVKPGIEYFSGEGLVKGEDYFDSVGDILRKVASEPQLLDLDAEKNGNDVLKEVTDSPPVMSVEEGISDQQHPSSLNYQNDITKWNFTIVDTSSIHEGKPYKVRKLSQSQVNSRTSIQHLVVGTSGDNSTMSDDKQSESTIKLYYKGRIMPERSVVTSTDARSKKPRTRDRPMTAKALEALEMGGFYNVRNRIRNAGTKKPANTLAEVRMRNVPLKQNRFL